MKRRFRVTDPRGIIIHCTNETWEEHVLVNHPDMTGKENEVIEALRNPFMIFADAEKPKERNIYYLLRTSMVKYIRVVVRLIGEKSGEMVTAYQADSGKENEKMIWPSSD